MKVIIEIEKPEDLEHLKSILGVNAVSLVDHSGDRRNALDALSRKYNITIPADYRFNRNEAHER